MFWDYNGMTFTGIYTIVSQKVKFYVLEIISSSRDMTEEKTPMHYVCVKRVHF
jgi:hypothetical protein